MNSSSDSSYTPAKEDGSLNETGWNVGVLHPAPLIVVGPQANEPNHTDPADKGTCWLLANARCLKVKKFLYDLKRRCGEENVRQSVQKVPSPHADSTTGDEQLATLHVSKKLDVFSFRYIQDACDMVLVRSLSDLEKRVASEMCINDSACIEKVDVVSEQMTQLVTNAWRVLAVTAEKRPTILWLSFHKKRAD
jgi:hypothetical protein